jgi:hypothetical protein
MRHNQMVRMPALCAALVLTSSLVSCSENDIDSRSATATPAFDAGLALTDVASSVGPDAVEPSGDTPVAPTVPPRDESAQVEVYFEGRYSAEAGSFEITSVDELITGRAQSGLRTVEQAAYCEITLDEDPFIGSGDVDTVEIDTVPFSVRFDDECGVSLLGFTYSDFGGALCADVRISSFMRSVVLRDVYAEINFMNPPTGHTGFTAAEFEQFGLGTGAEPPPPDNGSPIDAFGLWYYGELRTIAEIPANASTVRWVFRRENDADIYFRGRVVAKFTETCNNRDDDCDGNIDEGAGCIAIGGFCTQNADCANNICIAGQCRPDACVDGVRNNGETDLDCGGPCGASCGFGESCLSGGDCQSALCDTLLCSDGVDTDNDGRTDIADNCVDVPNPLQQNNDGDTFGDACDPDDDNDGFGDPADNCPLVANPTQADGDNDGLGDACDECPGDSVNDNDGDLICGNADNCPTVNNPDQLDQDGDLVGDVCDPDIDGDSVNNATDNCPTSVNPLQENNDGDSQGDVCDDDDDNDGTPDSTDNCPVLANNQSDADADLLGDACDVCSADPNNDVDADAVCGDLDNCPTAPNTDQQNSDGAPDGGDACDNDDDNDGLNDDSDNCPTVAGASQIDTDGDGQGDLCDDDDDNDFLLDINDNCPFVLNPDQTNTDGQPDGGDACDADDDNDGVADGGDNCPLNPNALQQDGDNDGLGDACDLDSDNDSVLDTADNCPFVANPGQENTDGLNDGGDACDNDDDQDLIPDGSDNCRTAVNPGQENLDGDLTGDACDNDIDGDGVPNEVDNCDFNINPLQENLDGDPEGDICDADDDGDGEDDLTDNCPVISNNDQLNFDGDSLGDACDTDDDNDGSIDTVDCAPLNNTIRPGAAETTGDGVDQNCDGSELCFLDNDNDGFRPGTGSSTLVSVDADCDDTREALATEPTADCNDSVSTVFPGATEVIGDGIDQNCDTDELCFLDNDNDNFRPLIPATIVSDDLDCLDAREATATDPATDCNDDISTVNPGATEACNTVDDDCDGAIDEGVLTTWYRDIDGDTWGNPGFGVVQACTRPATYAAVRAQDDCNDNASSVFPGATEVCDEQDNDCDGATDEGVQQTFYRDLDGDTYGRAASGAVSACSAPAGYVTSQSDCNDSNGAINPVATEICDAADNDCDGLVNEAPSSSTSGTLTQNSWTGSAGARNVGTCRDQIQTCNISGNWLTTQTQLLPVAEVCDNLDNNCNGTRDEAITQSCYTGPGGTQNVGPCRGGTATCSAGSFGACIGQVTPVAEVCDNTDNDCDNVIDDGVRPTWYQDSDGDGYGGSTSSSSCTSPGVSWITTGGDCDDANSRRTPGRAEICDGLDNDCNGSFPTANRPLGNGSSGNRVVEYSSACASWANNVSDNDECFGWSYNGRGYMLCHYHESWDNARTRCTERGMDLIIMNDQAENTALINEFHAQDRQNWDHLWIGARETNAGSSSFNWVNGTSAMAGVAPFTNWRTTSSNTSITDGARIYQSSRTDSPPWRWEPNTLGTGQEFICEW